MKSKNNIGYRKWLAGEVVGAIGMTEPGAGSDLQSMRSSAILQGDHYL